jgi:hypothetical protein
VSRQGVKGDLLFRIDDPDDTIAVEQAEGGRGCPGELDSVFQIRTFAAPRAAAAPDRRHERCLVPGGRPLQHHARSEAQTERAVRDPRADGPMTAACG